MVITNKELSNKYNILSYNIKFYRKINKITQEQLAELSDLSTSYIKQIESGKEFKNLTLNSMLKISKALNVSIDKLFEEKTN